MKRLWFLICMLVPFIFLASCNQDKKTEDSMENLIGIVDGKKQEEENLPDFTCSCYKHTLVVGETLDFDTQFGNNVSDRKIEWSTSNSDILSVSNGKVTANELGSATITVKALNGNFIEEYEFNIVKKAKLTVMYYICGANLAPYEEMSIADMVHTANQPEDVNIIVETGGSSMWTQDSQWSEFEISNDCLQRYYIRDNQLILEDELELQSMGSKECFQSFIEWGINDYPAERTGVVFQSHGGAIKGVCPDWLFQKDRLLNGETKRALTDAFKATRREEKLEFIIYNSCVMAEQDVADFNSEFFNYMVASQEYMWLPDSIMYHWIPSVYEKKDTVTLLQDYIHSYIDYSFYYTDALTCLDLSHMEDYRNAFEAMAKELSKRINKDNNEEFVKLIRQTKCFGAEMEEDKPYDKHNTAFGIYDVKDFIKNLSLSETFNPGKEYTDKVLEEFDKVVIFHLQPEWVISDEYYDEFDKTANGLNMFWNNSSICDGGLYNTHNTAFYNWLEIVSNYAILD